MRFYGFPHSSVGKESTCNAGDPSLIPGLGRSPGEGNGYSLQYSDLENSTDGRVHGVTKSRAQLSNFHLRGFPGSSVGKESTCNAGDPSSIPGSGRSPGEGLDYPLQYSLVVQTVKNLPSMWETWVRSLGWEDPLEEGMETQSSILAWRIPWTEEPGGLQSMGSQQVRPGLATNT